MPQGACIFQDMFDPPDYPRVEEIPGDETCPQAHNYGKEYR